MNLISVSDLYYEFVLFIFAFFNLFSYRSLVST